MSLKSWVVILIFFVFAASSYATPKCVNAFTYAPEIRLQVGTPSSGVELEVAITDRVMSLVTTEDGKLGSIINARKQFVLNDPVNYEGKLLKTLPRLADFNMPISQIPWSGLNFSEQKAAISEVSQGLDFSHRQIFGVVVKPSITTSLSTRMNIGSDFYGPGTVNFPLAKYLTTTQVEFSSPKDYGNFLGVELHLRSQGLGGDASLYGRQLLTLLGISQVDQHVHLVSEIPNIARSEDDNLVPLTAAEFAALATEFVGLANLAAEVIGIVEEDSWLTENSDFGLPLSYNIFSEELSKIYESLLSSNPMSTGIWQVKDKFKVGRVSIRGTDKYVGIKLWGLEYRSILKNGDPIRTQNIVNQIHQRFLSLDIGLTSQEIMDFHAQKWLEIVPGADPKYRSSWVKNHFNRSHYHSEELTNFAVDKNDDGLTNHLSTILPAELYNMIMSGIGLNKLRDSIVDNRKIHHMLLFNWKNHILFRGDQAAQDKAYYAQKKAIRRWVRGERMLDIVQTFLIESEVYSRSLRIFGIEPLV
jgi:hypothetical protein